MESGVDQNPLDSCYNDNESEVNPGESMTEWTRHQELVLSELKRLSSNIERLTDDLVGHRIIMASELSALKVKAGAFGFLAGCLPAALQLGINHFVK